jgi:hypothetical protein
LKEAQILICRFLMIIIRKVSQQKQKIKTLMGHKEQTVLLLNRTPLQRKL